jgi:hypothetical protein
MRTTLLTLMVVLPTAGVLNAAWCGSALSAFARAVPRIASTSDLEQFKRVVATRCTRRWSSSCCSGCRR